MELCDQLEATADEAQQKELMTEILKSLPISSTSSASVRSRASTA
jgi:hypothetical protein